MLTQRAGRKYHGGPIISILQIACESLCLRYLNATSSSFLLTDLALTLYKWLDPALLSFLSSLWAQLFHLEDAFLRAAIPALSI